MGLLDEIVGGLVRGLSTSYGHSGNAELDAHIQHYLAKGYEVVNMSGGSVTMRKRNVLLPDDVVTFRLGADGRVY